MGPLRDDIMIYGPIKTKVKWHTEVNGPTSKGAHRGKWAHEGKGVHRGKWAHGGKVTHRGIMTTHCLSVAKNSSINRCGRLSQPSWLLVCTII